MTTRRFPKLVPLLCAAALSFGAAACGDDDDTVDAAPRIDADTTDAAPTPDATPDAMQAQDTVTGSIAVVDMQYITDPAVSTDSNTWFRGAYVDINMVEYPPAKTPFYYDIVPPGIGCSATHYDYAGGDTLPDELDEGDITIADTLSPIAPCTLVTASTGYVCIAAAGATATGDTFVPDGNLQTATVTIAGATFDATNQSQAGMWMSLSGFSDPTGGLDPYNGEFPIVGVLSATSVRVAFPLPSALPADGTTTGGAYIVVSGAGPTPAKVPFLDDAAEIKLSKTAGTETVAFTDVGIIPGGKGFVPDDETVAAIATFPTDSTTPIDLGCDGTNGVCGAGVTTGTIVVIRAYGATDYVSVSCRALADHVSVPVEIISEIAGITPVAIQTTVFRANFTFGPENADGVNVIGIVAGYGVVGVYEP